MSVTSTRAHFRTKYYSLNCFPLLLMFTRDEKSLLKPIQWLFCHKKGNLCLPISVQKVKDNLTSFESEKEHIPCRQTAWPFFERNARSVCISVGKLAMSRNTTKTQKNQFNSQNKHNPTLLFGTVLFVLENMTNSKTLQIAKIHGWFSTLKMDMSFMLLFPLAPKISNSP